VRARRACFAQPSLNLSSPFRAAEAPPAIQLAAFSPFSFLPRAVTDVKLRFPPCLRLAYGQFSSAPGPKFAAASLNLIRGARPSLSSPITLPGSTAPSPGNHPATVEEYAFPPHPRVSSRCAAFPLQVSSEKASRGSPCCHFFASIPRPCSTGSPCRGAQPHRTPLIPRRLTRSPALSSARVRSFPSSGKFRNWHRRSDVLALPPIPLPLPPPVLPPYIPPTHLRHSFSSPSYLRDGGD